MLRLVYIMRISYDQLTSMIYLDHRTLKDMTNHMVLHVDFLLVACLTCSYGIALSSTKKLHMSGNIFLDETVRIMRYCSGVG